MFSRRFGVLVVVFALVAATGCRTEEEKVRRTLRSFVEAEALYDAPYRAYAFIAGDDKEAVGVEEYASGFGEPPPDVDEDATVEIVTIDVDEGRAEGTVRVVSSGHAADDVPTRSYVLVRDDGRWRVWLGLTRLVEMRESLDEARALARRGDVEEAREKLEAVATTPFRASRPDLLEHEVATVRTFIDDQVRFAEIEERLTDTPGLEVDDLEAELNEIDGMLHPGEDQFDERLADLRAELRKRQRERAIEELRVAEVDVRRTLEKRGVVKEATFTIVNNVERPLETVTVEIGYPNEPGGRPQDISRHELFAGDDVLRPGEEFRYEKEANEAPSGWRGRLITVDVVDLEFADEDGEAPVDEG